VTAVAATLYGVASTVYMPRQLESYSERYGLFGVTLALIGWLLGMALIVVAATAVAAELDHTEDPWARRIRRAIHVEPVAVPAAPVQEPALTDQAPSPSSPSSHVPITRGCARRGVGNPRRWLDPEGTGEQRLWPPPWRRTRGVS